MNNNPTLQHIRTETLGRLLADTRVPEDAKSSIMDELDDRKYDEREVMHKAVGVEWERGSLCGKSSKLPNGEDVTPRSVDDSRVTCKLCLRSMGR